LPVGPVIEFTKADGVDVQRIGNCAAEDVAFDGSQYQAVLVGTVRARVQNFPENVFAILFRDLDHRDGS
jgi:hypothetical protein